MLDIPAMSHEDKMICKYETRLYDVLKSIITHLQHSLYPKKNKENILYAMKGLVIAVYTVAIHHKMVLLYEINQLVTNKDYFTSLEDVFKDRDPNSLKNNYFFSKDFLNKQIKSEGFIISFTKIMLKNMPYDVGMGRDLCEDIIDFVRSALVIDQVCATIFNAIDLHCERYQEYERKHNSNK